MEATGGGGGRPGAPPGVNSRSAVSGHSAEDLEVLRNIEAVYFAAPRSVDARRHVLERAPAPADCVAIERMFTELKRQQQVVSGKALHLIQQQRDNCDREFREIQALRRSLSTALDECRAARAHVRAASDRLTVSTLTILANFRRREIARCVLKSLELLRALRDADRDVAERLARRDYDGAISLVLECRKAAAAHGEYACVEALAARLQDTLEMTEEKLDSVLASLCRCFDEATFARLRRAYALLGKMQASMEQLHMHYSSAVNESAVDAVKAYVSDRGADKLQDLCRAVPPMKAPACLLDLCESLFLVMRSYYLLVEWHSKHDEEELTDSSNAALEFEKNVSKEYIRQKLKAGLIRIWHDVQAKVSTFLKCTGLEEYPFEKFLQILGILRKLTQVAEVFCGDKADILQDFIKTHSVAYIKNYHHGRMDELKLFLENEGWEQCPVKANFTLMNLQEFRSLKKYLNVNYKSDVSIVNSKANTISDGTSSVNSQDDSVYIAKYFKSKTRHTPFDMFRSESVTNDDIFGLEPETEVPSDESEDEPDELKKEFVDENAASETNSHASKSVRVSPIRSGTKDVIVTNTTLSVLRHCGQYVQMCRYLPPIALEVIMLMYQLYDYYIYSVHLFFTADLEVASNTLYSAKLNSALKRIANNVESTEEEKIGLPEMPQHLELLEESLHGLSERIVAVESVIFLTRQLEILHPYLESIVSPHQRMILQHYRDNTLAASSDLRNPVYMCSASKSVDIRSVLVAMSQVKWDIKSVAAEHSTYVDLMVRQLQVFALRLDNVATKVALNVEIANAVWAMVAKFVVHLLVEGFSNATKCSNGGRGLMQLDYTQLFVNMEKISGLKPIPYQEYVDRYVKAYYLPRASLEEFVRERTEYSNKHLLALVACACENKRDRQELASLVESRNS